MEGRSDDNRNKKRTGDISAWKRTGREGISGAGVYADRRSWCWENCVYAGLCGRSWITEPVNSPTFTIVQVYEEGRLPFYHFDVYRIGDVEEMDEVGFEDYVMGEGVSLIEWANLIEEILPQKRTEITIEKNLEEGFDYRKITVEETV